LKMKCYFVFVFLHSQCVYFNFDLFSIHIDTTSSISIWIEIFINIW
jgi:hypothetical protein